MPSPAPPRLTSVPNDHPALGHCWHPVARSEDSAERPVGVVVLGEPWVPYRASSSVVAFPDRCPRGAR